MQILNSRNRLKCRPEDKLNIQIMLLLVDNIRRFTFLYYNLNFIGVIIELKLYLHEKQTKEICVKLFPENFFAKQ